MASFACCDVPNPSPPLIRTAVFRERGEHHRRGRGTFSRFGQKPISRISIVRKRSPKGVHCDTGLMVCIGFVREVLIRIVRKPFANRTQGGFRGIPEATIREEWHRRESERSGSDTPSGHGTNSDASEGAMDGALLLRYAPSCKICSLGDGWVIACC